MRRIISTAIVLLAFGTVPVLAQGAGGGSGATQTSPSAAACTAPGADGKPSRKLSSEEVCPMYSFWRDDCARADRMGATEAAGHCGPAAMGRADDRDLVTGSIRPAAR